MGRIWEFEKFSNNEALFDENGEVLTYGQLSIETEKLAKTVGRRCLVFSLCRNAIGSVFGYIAFANNGIVPVMGIKNI